MIKNAKAYQYDILIRPVVTEKSSRCYEENKMTFIVRQDATKKSIKEAVEKIFDTEVLWVNSMNSSVKFRIMRDRHGCGGYKKAIVKLADNKLISKLAEI